jgi:hypothetical protein
MITKKPEVVNTYGLLVCYLENAAASRIHSFFLVSGSSSTFFETFLLDLFKRLFIYLPSAFEPNHAAITALSFESCSNLIHSLAKTPISARE